MTIHRKDYHKEGAMRTANHKAQERLRANKLYEAQVETSVDGLLWETRAKIQLPGLGKVRLKVLTPTGEALATAYVDLGKVIIEKAKLKGQDNGEKTETSTGKEQENGYDDGPHNNC